MSENTEERAVELGWVPQDQWKDAPEKWVPADVFVERGEIVLPILRKQNRELHAGMTSLRSELDQAKTALEQTNGVIEDLKKFHVETVAERVKDARNRLKDELIQAKKDNNVEQEVELQDQITALDRANTAALQEEKETKQVVTQTQQTKVDPVVEAWMGENTWFQKDPEKTALAVGVAERLRKEEGLTGRALLDKVTKRVDEVFGVRREPIDRTEGARHSGGNGSNSSVSSYASLPAEAREVCDKQASRFVGKPGFPDRASWDKHFVEQYNAGA